MRYRLPNTRPDPLVKLVSVHYGFVNGNKKELPPIYSLRVMGQGGSLAPPVKTSISGGEDTLGLGGGEENICHAPASLVKEKLAA